MIKSLIIIFGCLIAGNIIDMVFNLSCPASIVGLIFLFLLLKMQFVKVDDVSKVSSSLLDTLTLFIIVPFVGILDYLDTLATDGWLIVLSSALSTLMVLAFTAHLHQWFRKNAKTKTLKLRK